MKKFSLTSSLLLLIYRLHFDVGARTRPDKVESASAFSFFFPEAHRAEPNVNILVHATVAMDTVPTLGWVPYPSIVSTT